MNDPRGGELNPIEIKKKKNYRNLKKKTLYL